MAHLASKGSRSSIGRLLKSPTDSSSRISREAATQGWCVLRRPHGVDKARHFHDSIRRGSAHTNQVTARTSTLADQPPAGRLWKKRPFSSKDTSTSLPQSLSESAGESKGELKGELTREVAEQTTPTPASSLTMHGGGFSDGATSAPSLRTDLETVWVQETERLLHGISLGEFDSKAWSDAHLTILWWLKQSVSPKEVDVRCCTMPFQLLDRMLEEEQSVLLHLESIADGDAGDVLRQGTVAANIPIVDAWSTDLVNLVVNHWRKEMSLIESLPNHKELHAALIEGNAYPSHVFERIQNYNASSKFVQPDTQTIAMIIDATSKVPRANQDRHGAPLASKMLDWSVQEATLEIHPGVEDMHDLHSVNSNGNGISSVLDENHLRAQSGFAEEEVGLSSDLMTETAETALDPSMDVAAISSQSVGPSDDASALDGALDNSRLRPNAYTFASAIHSWGKSKLDEAPQKADELLYKLLELSVSRQDWQLKPNIVMYSSLVDVWSKAGNVKRVEELLNEMYDLSQGSGMEDLKPNLPVFNLYLAVLAKRRMTARVEEVLQQMEEFYEMGEISSPPDVVSYSTAIDCFVKADDVELGATKAEQLLNRMIRRDVAPNAVTFNTVIHAHAKAGNFKRVDQLLSMMHDLHAKGGSEVRPTLYSYSSVLVALSKSKDREASTRAMALLDAMIKLAAAGELEHAPDLISYNLVLDCFKTSSRPLLREAKQFLRRMRSEGVEPDRYSYNIVLHLMAKAGRHEAAGSLIKQMGSHGVAPDTTSYNTLLSALAKSKDRNVAPRAEHLLRAMEHSESITADIISYNTTLNCHSMNKDGPSAEALLNRMMSDETNIEPDAVSFNTTIAAWSKMGTLQAAYRAQQLFDAMGDYSPITKPNAVAFNTLLSAWARSKDPLAPQRMENMVRDQTMKYNQGESNACPDNFSITAVMLAWSHSDHPSAPEKVEEIFQGILRRFRDGERKMMPCTRAYSALIGVWSNSGRPDGGSRAEMYLDELLRNATNQRDFDVQPMHFAKVIQGYIRSSSAPAHAVVGDDNDAGDDIDDDDINGIHASSDADTDVGDNVGMDVDVDVDNLSSRSEVNDSVHDDDDDADLVESIASIISKMEHYQHKQRTNGRKMDVYFFGNLFRFLAEHECDQKDEVLEYLLDTMRRLRVRHNHYVNQQIEVCLGVDQSGGDSENDDDDIDEAAHGADG